MPTSLPPKLSIQVAAQLHTQTHTNTNKHTQIQTHMNRVLRSHLIEIPGSIACSVLPLHSLALD
jgi:hypothetical protein